MDVRKIHQPRPRVLLCDDHTLVREGLVQLLADDLDVVDAVEDGRALLQAAERWKPDVVLLDITLPLLNGFDAARQLACISPASKIVFVTCHAESTYVHEAFRAGASGYVLKTAASTDLLAAVTAVLNGERYLSPGLAARHADLLAGDQPVPQPGELADRLTPRQREVLQLVAEGRTAREIAVVLTLSRKTVEFHKASIMRLLGLRTIAELTRYALEHGILGPS
nr:response regulator transcription factor [Nannocystis sp.]